MQPLSQKFTIIIKNQIQVAQNIDNKINENNPQINIPMLTSCRTIEFWLKLINIKINQYYLQSQQFLSQSKMKTKGDQTLLSPNYREGGHCVSVDRGDKRVASLQSELVKLQQKQKNLNSYYENKIKQLASIIQQQQSVRQGLIQQLTVLSKQSGHLNSYIESWRQQLGVNGDLGAPNKHRDFASKPFHACSPVPKQQTRHTHAHRQSKAKLFQSNNLRDGLLKQSKSQKLIESQYWPQKNGEIAHNPLKKNIQSCRLFL